MNDESNFKVPAAPALPATRLELEALRKSKKIPTINEAVDAICDSLWEVPDFQRFLLAIDDSQAVEGSTKIDDTKAAEMIRDYGVQHGIRNVAEAKLHAVVLAMRVKLRRHGQSREERRLQVIGDEESELNNSE
jgi:hypothetical protein